MTLALATIFVASAGFIDWLLGLQALSWSHNDAELGWRHPLPAWGWILLILLAALFASWSYSRLLGNKAARSALAVTRAVLILLIIALLCGPMLVLPQEQVEPDSLLILVDRSASMQIQDVRAGPGIVSRDQALREALSRQNEVFSPQNLGRDRQLIWLGFDSGSYDIAAPGPQPQSLQEAQGRATAIRTAIEQALERAAGKPISGVVLFSDGRSPQTTGADLIRRLQQEAVSVFSVPLGAKEIPLDLAVGRVDAPDQAFINDTVPVRVWVDRFPADAALPQKSVTVQLLDRATGKVLDEKAPLSLDQPVLLHSESAVAGPATWQIKIVYEGVAGGSGLGQELVRDNNSKLINLELIDRPIRLLLVEGYPRWEYRYFKNFLVREKSIQSSILLISADPDFAQEGDQPITRLPIDAREFEPFDVIVIGDVPPSYFSTEQLGLIRDQVASRGTGLLLLGGAREMPRGYDGTVLADLLPMRRPGAVERLNSPAGQVALFPTPLAEALNVLRLRSAAGGHGDASWPADLPPLLWAQSLGALKPTAEVLAVGMPLVDGAPVSAPPAAGGNRPAEAGVPVLVRLRYGAGEVLYMASDETWRWRFGKGELYFEQFWTQLVQMLGRGRVQRRSEGVVFDLSHHRLEFDQPLVVQLRIDDPLLLKRQLPRIAVDIFRADDPAHAIDHLDLLLQNAGGSAADAASALPGRLYQALWRPSHAGTLVLRVTEPALDERNLTQQLEVIHPEDELRQPATDHDRLAQLAHATGGEVVPLDHLEELQRLVPNRARRTPLDIREALWDSPLALALVLLLLTAEWVGRKMTRLV